MGSEGGFQLAVNSGLGVMALKGGGDVFSSVISTQHFDGSGEFLFNECLEGLEGLEGVTFVGEEVYLGEPRVVIDEC